MLFVITVHDYNIQRDLITTTIEKRSVKAFESENEREAREKYLKA